IQRGARARGARIRPRRRKTEFDCAASGQALDAGCSVYAAGPHGSDRMDYLWGGRSRAGCSADQNPASVIATAGRAPPPQRWHSSPAVSVCQKALSARCDQQFGKLSGHVEHHVMTARHVDDVPAAAIVLQSLSDRRERRSRSRTIAGGEDIGTPGYSPDSACKLKLLLEAGERM